MAGSYIHWYEDISELLGETLEGIETSGLPHFDTDDFATWFWKNSIWSKTAWSNSTTVTVLCSCMWCTACLHVHSHKCLSTFNLPIRDGGCARLSGLKLVSSPDPPSTLQKEGLGTRLGWIKHEKRAMAINILSWTAVWLEGLIPIVCTAVLNFITLI